MDEAKKQRKTAKRLFTAAIKNMEALNESSTVSQIDKSIEKMETMYDNLVTANDTVICAIDDNCSESELDEHLNYLNDVNKKRAEMTALVQKFTMEIKKNEVKEKKMSSLPSSSLSQPTKCQLQRLKVQEFKGNIRMYPTWKSSFQKCMTKYCQDEDEQLQRLKDAVLPPVRNEIVHCQSIESAFELLDQSYGNEDELMALLLHDIKSYQPIKHSNFKNLKALASEIRSFITRVKDLNKEADLKADYLLADIMEKLPGDDQYKYKAYCRDKYIRKSIESLATWIAEEAQLRHSITDELKQSNLNGSTNTTTAKPQNTVSRHNCVLGCNTSHILKECPRFKSMNVSERWEVVKTNKCCFCCLKRGHHTQTCFEKKQCSKEGCDKNHHVLLHLDNDNTPPTTSSHSAVNTMGCGHLPVVKVTIYDDYGVTHNAVAMIDSGSQQSLVRKAFANKLRLTGNQSQDLQIQLAGGGGHVERSKNYEMKIAADDSSPIFKLNAMSLETVCADIAPIDKSLLAKYPHLVGITNKIYHDGGKVDLLIGTNFTTAFKEIGSCYSADQDAPIAKQTPLGWVLLGELGNATSLRYVNHVSVISEPNIAKMFELDNLGVKPTRLCTCNDDELAETAFIEQVKRDVEFEPDGRIKMRMPWKPGHPSFPNNHPMALKRLYSLERKLIQSGKVEVYNEEIQKLLDDDFCVKLKEEDIDWSKPFWLLPHHAVERPDASSTRVRIVFDSAAQYDGICLNDALEKGPNYLNDLFKVLIGWRQDIIAYCGDIRKMFNMIAIHPDDQPYHRFLWRNCDTSQQPSVYQWTRLSFGDKSSPDLACSGIRLLAKQNELNSPLAKDTLMNHIYMDDIADSTGDVATSHQTILEVDKVLQQGHFNIKAWHSNNATIDKARDEKIIAILGHTWDKGNDEISLKVKDFSRIPDKLTKRTVFGRIAQCWDPLGLVSPTTIKLKIEMQTLWSHGYCWDEEFPSEEKSKWIQLLSSLSDIHEFRVQRCTKPHNAVGLPQIHGFSDGGESGYGSCVFLRWSLDNGSFACRVAAAKAFVAPLKRKTIPRLELMGCVTLTRLMESVMSALRTPIEHLVLWTDSSTALSWIRTPPRSFKPFVGVRVAEIQESYDPMVWRYVPTECNPADALTKGIPLKMLSKWHQGPEFLSEPENKWPKHEELKRSGKDDPERKPIKITAAQVTEDITSTFNDRTQSWTKIRRYAAVWMRFINNCKAKVESRDRQTGNLTSHEILQAEKRLIKLAQGNIDPQDKTLLHLQPFYDGDGVLRTKGRLELAENLPYDVRHPIILPKRHNFAKRILEYLHRSLGHPGYKRLMSEFRQKFWITGLRDLVKSIYFQCVQCKRRRQPLCEQLMGPLPSFRVEPLSPPFANTAVDLFGPLKVKLGRRTTDKGYGCLFTCLTTRAVHTELVMEESTEHFLMALRRFAALRGWPKLMYSDNGTNFVGSQAYLREMIDNWNHTKVQHTCAEKGSIFQWNFNCPTASHMNGAVESLIKSIKKAVDGTYGFATYTQSQWMTILYESSYLINSRPLYPSSDDILDAPPITPNTLLLGHGLIVPQPEPQDVVNPRNLYSAVQHRVQLFWEQWMRHFAPTLVPRNKWFRNRDNLTVGDLCIILDPHCPRALWKLALVEELIPSEDGLVRKVIVKTSTGFYERPIHKLCLIATKEQIGYSNPN